VREALAYKKNYSKRMIFIQKDYFYTVILSIQSIFMAKVLKITRADGTNHVLPLTSQNKSFWQKWNSRNKNERDKVTVDEIDEKEAEKLPFKDPNHVTPSQAVVKLDEYKSQLSEKDAEIEGLKALLAAQQETEDATKKAAKKTSEPKQ
jgi:hypothetical protein